MARFIRAFLVLLIIAVIIGLPAGYASFRNSNFRNFRIVAPGVLYRSGQLSARGLQRVVHDFGIRTVVTLRDADVEGERPPDWQEEEFCKKMDIQYVRIRPQRWWAPTGGPVPAEAGVRKFLSIIDESANQPVLIHCMAGIHRTGAHIAIYRMEHDRWSNDRALQELRDCGYDHLDDEWDVLGYLESYQPRWKTNPK